MGSGFGFRVCVLGFRVRASAAFVPLSPKPYDASRDGLGCSRCCRCVPVGELSQYAYAYVAVKKNPNTNCYRVGGNTQGIVVGEGLEWGV